MGDLTPFFYNARMPIEPGQELLHYRLVEQIGEGGMGVVWKALDTKLNRDVAIKVLPEDLAGDALRLARFQREATTLASLNHPNIAAIYEVGVAPLPDKASPVHFLVMELVEGEDLSVLIQRGSVAVAEALPIARQIAEGLEAAHERGIVHRDLKPANVRITHEGRVKVLDFGLARAYDDDSAADTSFSTSPTLTAQMTQEGFILGTAAYMSPEQARGKRVDKRTDIWAFGVLVYEMLAGTRAYEGETVTDVIAAIVTREPDWDRLPATVPGRVKALLHRCLQKEPMQRLRDIGDARIEIDAVDQDPGVVDASGMLITRAPRSQAIPWVVAAVSIVIALAIWIGTRQAGSNATSLPGRFTVVLPPEQKVPQYAPIVLSPQGTDIVYEASVDGVAGLYRRRLDSLDPQLIPGTEGAAEPFVSPSGDAVGFYSNGATRTVPLDGGQGQEIAKGGRWLYGASWSPNGRIVMAPRWNSALFVMADTGGALEQVTTLDLSRGDVSHLWPQFLPDGELVLFTIWSPGRMKAGVVTLATGDVKIVHEGGYHYRYSPSGHLLFAMDDTLYATSFDLDLLEAGERPHPVAAGLFRYTVDGFAAYEISAAGVLAFRRGGDGVLNRIVWIDRQGEIQPGLATPGSYDRPSLSPDGERVAMVYASQEGPLQIGVYDLLGGTRIPLTSGDDNVEPLFTADGKGVVFTRSGPEGYQLFVTPADGSGLPKLLHEVDEGTLHAKSFSQDGKYLAYDVRHPVDGEDIFVVNLDGEREIHQLVQTPTGVALDPAISPDGDWVAYAADVTGRLEIYLVPLESEGRPVQITTSGGRLPRWNPSGNGELFYVAGNDLMVVSIDAKQGTPRIDGSHRKTLDLDGLEVQSEVGQMNYDVAPDGERFLFMHRVEPGPEANQIHVVLDAFREFEPR